MNPLINETISLVVIFILFYEDKSSPWNTMVIMINGLWLVAFHRRDIALRWGELWMTNGSTQLQRS